MLRLTQGGSSRDAVAEQAAAAIDTVAEAEEAAETAPVAKRVSTGEWQ